MDLDAKVRRTFLGLGLPINLYGYFYAKEGVCYVIRGKSLSGKQMLAHIAEKYNTGSKNIERCIRTMIETSWSNVRDVGLFVKRPTCREFVLRMAEYVSSSD